MSISKDKIIAEIGGFAWSEIQSLRLAEINVLEKRLRSGKFNEGHQRRLCELKGIDFDDLEDSSECLKNDLRSVRIAIPPIGNPARGCNPDHNIGDHPERLCLS